MSDAVVLWRIRRGAVVLMLCALIACCATRRAARGATDLWVGHWTTVPEVYRFWSASLHLRCDGTFHLVPVGGGAVEWKGNWSGSLSGVRLRVMWEEVGPLDGDPVTILLRRDTDDSLVSAWTPWFRPPFPEYEWRFERADRRFAVTTHGD